MKRTSLVLGALALALPIFSQVQDSWVQCLDKVVQPGEFVRVSGAVAGTTPTPTPEPTEVPTPEPTEEPTEVPTPEPTEEPTEVPTPEPTEEPTEVPTPEPTEEPTEVPTPEPTEEPTEVPTEVPTPEPTEEPTEVPTALPKQAPGDGEPYTLCLMPNRDWAGVAQVDCSECLAATEVMTEHGIFTEEMLGPIPEPGEYDVLLLEGGCGASLALLASDGEGEEAAVVAALGGSPIPSIMVPGMLILLALLALSGAVILRRG